MMLGASTITGCATSAPADETAAKENGLTAATLTVDNRTAEVAGYSIDGENYFNIDQLARELDAAVVDGKLNTEEHYKADEKTLITGNWAPETRARLQELIDNNADKGEYAVFDFDNTTSIYDIGNALFAYQIMNLRFAMTPETFTETLATGIPDLDQEIGRNLADEAVTSNMLIEDLSKDYEFIYNEYEGFEGEKTLVEIRATREYQDFAAKLRWMYDAVGDTFDVSIAYPWSIYMLSGMTPEEVNALGKESNEYWSEYGRYGHDTWTSPVDMETTVGVVSVSFDTGIAFPEELIDLYQTLMANGIEVYVVSASPHDLIAAAVEQFGYGIPQENVYGMRICTDENGRYINEYDYNWGGEGKYAQTYGPGKTTVIENFLAPQHEGQGPLLVCGDSMGDINMMTDWMEAGDTELGLIFNRYVKTSNEGLYEASVEASQNIGNLDSRFVLQGRDENNGCLRPSECTILQETDDEVLVREAE